MTRSRLLGWMLVCVSLVGCGDSDSDGAMDADAGGDAAGSGASGDLSWPSVSDFAAPGPFDSEQLAEGPACTIHRPRMLGEDGRRHPVIIWGNGTGGTPSIYGAALIHWASHGFIVAAANTSGAGTGEEMIACLDYLEAENARAGSPYEGKVDLGHVGTSGHSQGGGGAIMAGRDPRITATAPLQPYTQEGFGGFTGASIGEQSGPMFLMSGGADTIAAPQPNQQRVFDGINTEVFWGTLSTGSHLGTALGNIGGYRGPSTAWFRYHLMGDDDAGSLFYGADCGLCGDPAWENIQRSSAFE